MSNIQSPEGYTSLQVSAWINAIGFDSLTVEAFRENSIDGSMLVTLTEDDLISELGLNKLQARKFIQHLEFATELAMGSQMLNDPNIGKIEEQANLIAQLEEENENLRRQVQALKMQRGVTPASGFATKQEYSHPTNTKHDRPTNMAGIDGPMKEEQVISPDTQQKVDTQEEAADSPNGPSSPQKQKDGGKQKKERHVIKGGAKGAVGGAMLGAIGGAIAGDAGKGAKMGAAMGGTAGVLTGFGKRRRQRG